MMKKAAKKPVKSARNRRPAGKPKGKPLGMKKIKDNIAKEKADGKKVGFSKKDQEKAKKEAEAKEFRLKIKPEVETFWSVTENSWVIACEAETGKRMTMKVSSEKLAHRVKTQAIEKGDVNPSFWLDGVRKHPDDVVTPDAIRYLLLNVPGLTHGYLHNDQSVWYVWINGLKGYEADTKDQPFAIWSCTVTNLTRAELGWLNRLIDIYRLGYEYAMRQMRGNGKKR